MDPNKGNGVHNSQGDGEETKSIANPSSEQPNPSAETASSSETKGDKPEQKQTLEDVVAAAMENQPDASDKKEAKSEDGTPGEKQEDKDEKQAADASSDASSTKADDKTSETSDAADSSDSEKKLDQKDDNELSDEPSEEEIKSYGSRVQRRIKKLLDQRKEAEQAVDDLRPDAEAYREIQTFMTENDLKSEDVQQLFTFGQKLRQGQFEEALALAQPYVQLLMQGAGRAVPNDLRPRVDAGEITEEMAREVAKERVNAHYAQERIERQKERDQQQQLSTADKAIRDAADAWEDAKRQVDPDFEAKAATMKAFAVQLVQQYGSPRTPDEAKLLAEDAYKLTNEQFANMRPAKQPTRPEASSGSQQSSGSKAAPGSLEDAIRQGLEAAGHS